MKGTCGKPRACLNDSFVAAAANEAGRGGCFKQSAFAFGPSGYVQLRFGLLKH
jgi:hypothetical protein